MQERDGVVAALRVQLRQRQTAIDAQQSVSPALVLASSIAAERETAASNGPRVAYIGNEPDTYAPLLEELPGMSHEASELEAMWSTPSQMPRRVLSCSSADIKNQSAASDWQKNLLKHLQLSIIQLA